MAIETVSFLIHAGFVLLVYLAVARGTGRRTTVLDIANPAPPSPPIHAEGVRPIRFAVAALGATALLVIFVALAFDGITVLVDQVRPGWSMVLSVRGITLITAEVPPGNTDLNFALILVAVTAALTLMFRRGAAYPFLAFHLALGAGCLALVLLGADAPISDKPRVVAQALNLALAIIVVSQTFFLIFTRWSLRQVISSLVSVALSGAAYATGAASLGLLADVIDGPLMMLTLYLVIAYGIIGLHVAGLSITVFGARQPAGRAGTPQNRS